jgi:hypothetical protein
MSAERSDPDILIDAYFRNAREWRKDKPDWWAWEEVQAIVHEDPPSEAWGLILEMVRRAPEELVADVAAGPLEDLVTRAGSTLIDDIETACRREPRVRMALGGIWIRWGALPDAVTARLIRASGDRINPLARDPGSGPPRR